jgi:hypothetical protein
VKVAAVVLLLSALFLLLIWALGPAPADSPAPPPPPKAAEGPERDFADPDEDAVFEVEDLLADAAAQLSRGAWGGVRHALAADFQGCPWLRPPEGPERLTAGVRIRHASPDLRLLDPDAFTEALRAVPVDRAAFKLPSAALKGDVLAGRLRIDAFRADGPRATRWVSEGDAEFVRQTGSRWRLRRFTAASQRTEEGGIRFHDATAALGLRTPYGHDDRDAAQVTFGRLFLGGIAAGDVDSDGRPDLFLPEIGGARLYLNEGGRFRECAAERGIAFADSGSAALFLDVDNDGDLDLLAAAYEPEEVWDRRTRARVPNTGHRSLSLWRNDGGRFVDVTRPSGLEGRGPAMGLCAADIDLDGDLDVYVSRYRDETKDDPDAPQEVPADVGGARDGEPNQLWINQGDGTFREEAAARGVADPGWSLAAAFADYDGDGRPDLYVANDYGRNSLYRNLGGGRFEDVTDRSGTGDAGFGMGVLWADLDGDGRLDLHVSNMYSTAGNRILARGPGALPKDRHELLLKMASGNTLFRNRGDGTFENVTLAAGVGKAGWAWGAAAWDPDHDGLPDLYVANGFRTSSFGVADL